MTTKFWEQKSLQEMTHAEWESLCDGCGRCCLAKLQDDETDEVYFTSVACKLLDTESCRCTNYPKRLQLVPDCVGLTPDNLAEISWLPSPCAYRLVSEGKPLYDWHPLLSGSPKSVHDAGISVRGKVLSESFVHADDFEDHIIHWID